MNSIYKKHGLLFLEYLAFIIISHFMIKVFFHVPEVVNFGPVYLSILFAVFVFLCYRFYFDVRRFKRSGELN